MKIPFHTTTRILTLFLCFAFSNINYAQLKISPIPKKKHLKMLKEGVLLVRLPNVEDKLAAMKKAGYHKRAEKAEQENQAFHTMIKEIMTSKYDYSEAYFFYSSDAKAILSGNFEGHIFDSAGSTIDSLGYSFPYVYVGKVGTANPPEGYNRYNGKGLQILHIEDGKLFGIIGFYESGVDVFRLLAAEKVKYTLAVERLNWRLHRWSGDGF